MNWADFDLTRYTRPWAPLWLLQIATGIGVIAAFALLRGFIHLFAPAAAPFVLLYPAALIATILGRCPRAFLSLWWEKR